MFTEAIAALLAIACSQGEIGSELLRAGYAAVPMHTSGVGHLHTEGELNGKALEVLVDTGASNTIIDVDLARRLGLVLTPGPQSGAGIGAATVPVMLVEDAVFSVHDVAVPGPIYAMDFTSLRAALQARGSAVPGAVLGGDAMRALDAVLAYRQNQLYLRRPARPQP